MLTFFYKLHKIYIQINKQKEDYIMDAIVLQEIIGIINADLTPAQKRQMLRDANLNLPENEQTAKNIIVDLLSEHIMPYELGEPLCIYELQSATDDTYKDLSQILDASNYCYFNATCGELLWDYYHEVKYATKAIDGYWHELLTPSIRNDYSYYETALSICRIYSKYHIPDFNFNLFCDNCTEYLMNHTNKLRHFGVTLLKALHLCGKPFEIIENTAEYIIAKSEKSNDYDLAIAYAQLLETQYSNNKQTEKLLQTRERIAKLCEASANTYNWDDPAMAHRIIHEIQNAMNAWNRVGNSMAKEERKRLAKRIAPVKQASLKAMQTLKSEPYDLTEAINYLEDLIKNSSLEDNIYNLAFISKLESPVELEERRKNSPSFLSSMFATTIIDQAGRKKCIVPAYHNASQEDKIHVLEYNAAKKYSTLAQAFIIRYLYLLQKKEEVTEDLLRLIMKENAFVPEDRIESFVKGFSAGFKMDFITAIPILMPQAENAIRVMAETCGAVVYKTNTDGTEECLSLESILKLPEVVDCLEEDLLFNLRVFYTSEYGIGLRNNNAHGLLGDGQLQSDISIATWWFTLRLCCMFSHSFLKHRLEKTQKEEL